MAKYTLGKPTFNMDEPSHSIYQSATPHALIYDISLLDQVPTNQLASSINLQIGKAVRGVKVKYTNNKRFHLELAFFTKEATDTWEKKPITLIRKDLLPIRAFNGNKSFFSISLSGVPLCDTQEVTSQLQKIFGKVGKIATIKPKLWEGTSFTFDNWLITFDTTEIKDISMLSANIPRLVSISGDRVYVTWREAPKFCTFCRKSGHKRPDCNDLKNVKKNSREFDSRPKSSHQKATAAPQADATLESATLENSLSDTAPTILQQPLSIQ